MNCKRCGADTPRLTVDQRYCPDCAREVARIVRSDTERRRPRFTVGKDMTRLGSAL